jgi:succinyl-diaminopimelate desuccinylase
MDKLYTLVEDLVKIPSMHKHPEELQRACHFCKEWLLQKGLQVAEYSSNDYPSLVASPKNSIKKFRVLMVGHLDVVAANPENFTPRYEGNRLYARGASDMKGMDAVMMMLIEEAAKQGYDDVGLILTTDEEIGGMNGTRYIVDQGYQAEWVFVPDGGSNWKLVTEEKGILHLKLEVKGKTSQASMPWRGENAIEKLMKVFMRLREQFPELKEPQYTESLNIGRVVGGKSTNQVADKVEAYLDIRFTSRYNARSLLAKVEEIVGKDGRINTIVMSDVNSQQEHMEKILSFKHFVEDKTGKKIQLMKEYGGSDARFFGAKGIPSIIIKPDSRNQHAKNEWVDMRDLVKFYEVMREYIFRKDVA